MVDPSIVLIAGTAVLLGAVVQSGVGLGLGLVAAPVVAFLDPTLLPGALLVPLTVLPLLTVGAEYRFVDWRGLAWAVPARIVGVALGVGVVATVSPQLLAAGVGVMVLIAVVVSLLATSVRATPVSLTVAGVISGTTGTATSIGGPPMALVYQHADASRVRATLSVYFIIGCLMSIVGLWAGGQLPPDQVVTGVFFVPFLVVGFLVARPLRHVLSGNRLRVPLLVVVTVAGVSLLAQALL
ncbi:sulfite exporter TauE/SafE family protein [Spiractinospora alimapuensis]|uniref:sulfite exporter TauE/SafE family protein n=1 Tax=Spiractinospora alimapuensis TaxID=2820884 RepID=UPI001F48130F|nr:sulfite exporter TauE/SafE family protein [Spiractinospora alimapuensis]QVQ52405.1 sulfite exporter TauE/SafE family protein [Spiractinospora alimapuensis]